MFSASGVPFRTLTAATVSDAVLRAVQVPDGAAFADASGAWRVGLPIAAFGADPAPGDALYLGFAPAPPPGVALTLWLESATALPASTAAEHHSVRCVWETWSGAGWSPAAAVRDHTRALTVSGAVRLTPAATVATVASVVGAVPTPLAWIRCRITSGRHDAAPSLIAVAEHAVTAAQVSPAQRTFRINAGVEPLAPPTPGVTTHLHVAFDDQGHITELEAADDPALPRAAVLDYTPATPGEAGALTVELVLLGRGSGGPEQRVLLPGAPVAEGRARIWLLPDARRVRLVADLGASRPQDDDAVLEGQGGELRFGDGLHGRVPPAGSAIVAAYDTTLAPQGNFPADASWSGGAARARNPLPARGGADAEDLGPPTRRAAGTLWAHERLLELPAAASATLDGLPRAVVLARPAPSRLVIGLDAERLAFATPGAYVARARAWSGVDGRHPGLAAPDTLTVVVLPALPAGRPAPTAGLLAAVACFLDERRTLGTRVRVVGPAYVDLDLSARVTARPAADAAGVRAAVAERLRAFLHPLTGGAGEHGWPFGRDVSRSELLAVARGVAGVDSVDALVLRGCGSERCDVVPIPVTGLPAVASLEVTA